MNERDQFVTPQADAVLDRHLLSLQRLAPRHGFQDRVMARVRIPAPALIRFRQRARSLATPGRLWWASGLASAGSAAWTVALASLLSGLSPAAVGTRLSAELVQPLWGMVLQGAAVAAGSLTSSALATYSAVGNALFVIIASLMFLPVLSTWGLYLTMKQTRGKRIAPYAAH